MKELKLSYGERSFCEIEDYLNNNKKNGYSLSIYNELSESTAEIMCQFSDFLPVVMQISNIEHDFPDWIGINRLKKSYVIGMNFTKGRINTPGIYEYKNGKIIKID